MSQGTAMPTKPRRMLAILVPAGLMLAMAGGGFFVTYAGIIGGESSDQPMPADAAAASAFQFVPVDPITINLGGGAQARHLRFNARLEVAPQHVAEVTRLMPRILDVLNIYLRALAADELEEPSALLRLRGQMLRRIQVVTGPGLVNDLLIIEFLFN